jgi:hypothetical protein
VRFIISDVSSELKQAKGLNSKKGEEERRRNHVVSYFLPV